MRGSVANALCSLQGLMHSSDPAEGNGKLPKILLNGNNICMVTGSHATEPTFADLWSDGSRRRWPNSTGVDCTRLPMALLSDDGSRMGLDAVVCKKSVGLGLVVLCTGWFLGAGKRVHDRRRM